MSGTAVYLTKRELCRPSAAGVALLDKVVFSLQSGTEIEEQDCTNEAIYSHLEDAGAVAYIKQVSFGFIDFRRTLSKLVVSKLSWCR